MALQWRSTAGETYHQVKVKRNEARVFRDLLGGNLSKWAVLHWIFGLIDVGRRDTTKVVMVPPHVYGCRQWMDTSVCVRVKWEMEIVS